MGVRWAEAVFTTTGRGGSEAFLPMNRTQPAGDLTRRWMVGWSVRLPRALDRWAPGVADTLADGVWTAGLHRFVAAFLPWLALAAGFLAPEIWSSIAFVYTESLLFLAVAAAGAILSGPVGVGLAAGYVVRWLLILDVASSWQILLHRGGGQLISFGLLMILVVTIPRLGRRLARELPFRPPMELRLLLKAVLEAIACGGLVFIWCQATIVLIRPVFTWTGGSPTAQAIIPVQQSWRWIAGAAAVAAIVRVVLESLARRRGSASDVVGSLEKERLAEPLQRGALWRSLHPVVRGVVGAGVITLLLSGMYEGWLDALLVAAGAVALVLWNRGVFAPLPDGWVNALQRIPSLIRFAVPPLLGYVIARWILGIWWSSNSFRPVLVGAVVTLVLFGLAFPRRRLAEPGEGRPK